MSEQTSVTIFQAPNNPMTSQDSNLTPILRRLEDRSDEKKSAEEAIRVSAQAVVDLYRKQLAEEKSPSEIASMPEFQAARRAFQEKQYPYAEIELREMADLLESGCMGFAAIAYERGLSNNLNEVKTLISTLTSSETRSFRFDILISHILPLLSPLNHKIRTQNGSEDHPQEPSDDLVQASEVYARLKRIAEVTGQGTVLDHEYLWGKSKKDMIFEGLIDESELHGVGDEDVVKVIRSVGFIPNFMQKEDLDRKIAVTEPYIEPEIYF